MQILFLSKIAGVLGDGPDAPKPAKKLSPAQEKANAEQKLMDIGVTVRGLWTIATLLKVHGNRDFRTAAEQITPTEKARVRAAARWTEENQTIYNKRGPRPGSIDHAETTAVREAGKKRHTAEDAAAGATAGAPTQQIPLHATTDDLKTYSATAIRNWMGRRRRAGLPV